MNDRLGEKISAIELLHVVRCIVREEIGFNDRFADQIAEAIAHGIRNHMGGRDNYIPALDKTERDQKIRQEFNGRNHDEIMEKYNIGRRRIYQIIDTK